MFNDFRNSRSEHTTGRFDAVTELGIRGVSWNCCDRVLSFLELGETESQQVIMERW
jgi:hypothetical protein